MKPGLDISKKDILCDPISMYSQVHPEADKQKITTLGNYWMQYLSLNKQSKDIKNRTKELSRQIGEEKRNGRPTANLKNEMQKHSAQLRLLSMKSSTIEHEILKLFEYAETNIRTDKASPAPQQRIYRLPSQDIQQVTIDLLNKKHAGWNAYVDKNPAGSIYHRAEWRELIHNTFGHKSYYYLAKDREQKIVGVLPLVHLKSRTFGSFMVSMPYFNYGGAIADHPTIEQMLIKTANKQAAHLGVSHIEYRDDIPRDGMQTRTDKVNMILSLPDSPDTLTRTFSSKLRSQIRRPQCKSPTIHCGGKEYLNDFYSVFSINMRDLGTPVYSRTFFRNILHCFPDNSWIMIVSLARKPVAAGFLIGHRDMLEIPWASTLRDVNHLSMNMLLYWEILKFSIENGYRYFDFGRSSRDSGTYRFKQQWGATPKQLYWHYWLSHGEKPPAINPGNPKYALMINLWKRLPVPLTKLLGPSIVKNIP